jgi:hypothetical protein
MLMMIKGDVRMGPAHAITKARKMVSWWSIVFVFEKKKWFVGGRSSRMKMIWGM